VAIRADLEASPFVGEGHRKVSRLRILSDIRVSKDRICRLMRENALLSPHRVRQGTPALHDGSIQAEAPNLRWGTDGIRIQTVEVGNRFAALQPIAQGLHAEFGTTGVNAGKGLKLCMDHGT